MPIWCHLLGHEPTRRGGNCVQKCAKNKIKILLQIFQVLEAEPSHALAMAYYGYILKVHGGELERAVQLLRRAVRSGREEVTGNPKWEFLFYYF